MEYKDLYALEEDLHTEFKLAKTKVPLDFYETYFAFANTDGGDIYLGIEEEHEKVKGLPGIANWPIYQKEILDTIDYGKIKIIGADRKSYKTDGYEKAHILFRRVKKK